MSAPSPHLRLVFFALLAALGLWLFFANSMRVLGVDIGFLGSLLIAGAAWASVALVQGFPRSEGEAAIAPNEWQAWLGVLFMGAIWVATLLSVPVFNVPLPITRNPEAAAAGRNIVVLLVVWLVMSHVLKSRWGGQVTHDERDARIADQAGSWGRAATVVGVLILALWLGFSPPERLQQFSYAALAQLMMAAILFGTLTDHAVSALLYWRDRRLSAP